MNGGPWTWQRREVVVVPSLSRRIAHIRARGALANGKAAEVGRLAAHRQKSVAPMLLFNTSATRVASCRSKRSAQTNSLEMRLQCLLLRFDVIAQP